MNVTIASAPIISRCNYVASGFVSGACRKRLKKAPITGGGWLNRSFGDLDYGDLKMYVYQEEAGQIGLIFGIVLQKRDMVQILEHNPINFGIGQLKINISFCEPSKPVSFDVERGMYFISLGYNEIRFIRGGNALVAVHIIEEVQFMLLIFLEKKKRKIRSRADEKLELLQYMFLRGSEPGGWEEVS